ncbi:MAG: tRNA (adenosine(37)-N6)-threonylcarbamoyltransferase complex dimerization subunit type 1 TsaB, partial [Candidatus Omnitrophica bacterium]|nr:tRNA (adenosine(37)-N6)-threonylcarbamoyltransferase complex dimerization subunit type 1 TsaB [Candidatus Omnitrophota bacterium]
SISVVDDDSVLAALDDENELKHSSLVIPTIDKALKKSRLNLREIDVISLSIGPGSFTGLRIGVAVCKGINMALGIPIVEVPTLDVIAYNFIDEKEERLCPIIDAKKQNVYARIYENTYCRPEATGAYGLCPLTDCMLLDIDTLLDKIDNTTLVFGDGTELYGNRIKKNRFAKISDKRWLPRAETVARLGLRKAYKRQFISPERLVPMYLYSKYCQVKDYKK